MICEMCGMEVPKLKKIAIEGSSLDVCFNCAKFGQDRTTSKDGTEPGHTPTIAERLERRKKRLTTKDVFTDGSEGAEELAMDYPKRIRKARSSLNLSQDELGRKINEKKSIVAKLENGDMVPDEKLIKKLETTLNISLKEKIGPVTTPKKSGDVKGMTLGDFIRVEKE